MGRLSRSAQCNHRNPCKREREAGGLELEKSIEPLVLKMVEGATNQSMQVASRNWKRHGMDSALKSPEKTLFF